MSHKHFTINERNKIEVLNKEGYSARKIAKIIGYHHSSVSRELARCTDYYCAFKADKDNRIKSKNKGRKIKLRECLKRIKRLENSYAKYEENQVDVNRQFRPSKYIKEEAR